MKKNQKTFISEVYDKKYYTEFCRTPDEFSKAGVLSGYHFVLDLLNPKVGEKILDIGCGTGNVIPALEKRGQVTGIDISPKVIEVAKQRGCDNCIVADIFKYSPKQKFDTITLFGNDLGIGGTVRKTKKLLQGLKSLLKNDGQILAIIRNYSHGDYKEMTLIPMWKKKVGPKFGWLIFNINFLSVLCKEQNLNMQVISTNWKYSLVKMIKK